MIDGGEKRKCQLDFKLQNSRVYEKRGNRPQQHQPIALGVKKAHFHRRSSFIHSVNGAFLSLARLWRTRERLSLNPIRSLLSMRCMLPGYSFVPRPNNRALGFQRAHL